jgi:MTH538 TIR-like domain (DUF1863)
MPRLRTYRIFICHSWTYADQRRILKLLRPTLYFRYADYSVPEHNPLNTKNDSELRDALSEQIRQVQIVLVSAGMEVNFKYWIQFELSYAQQLEKPIIAIVPRGRQNIPKLIQDAGWPLVYWNRKSIIEAIRFYSL